MKIAAIQMCSSHQLEENLEQAKRLLKEASKEGALLAVLPEMFPIFGLRSKDKITLQEEYGRGAIQSFLSEQSKENNIWIIGGTIPISTSDPSKIRAACLVYNNKGERIVRYDKIHLFDATVNTKRYYESEDMEAGELEAIVVDTPVGKVGLAVCYDMRFPLMFEALSNKGAEIFCVPSAFTYETGKAHWELLSRTRAVENLSYFVGACQGGKHTNGRITYGHSLIVDPWGMVIAEQNDEPGVIVTNIDLQNLRDKRAKLPALEHRKFTVSDTKTTAQPAANSYSFSSS